MLEIETELCIGPMWLCDSCWDRHRDDILRDVLAAFAQAMPRQVGDYHNLAVHPDLYAKRDFLRNEVTVLLGFGMMSSQEVTYAQAPYVAELVRAAVHGCVFTEADWRNYEAGQVSLPQITGVDILSVKVFRSPAGWYTRETNPPAPIN